MNCITSKVGCELVKENYQIIATGYNRTTINTENCIESNCKHCKTEHVLLITEINVKDCKLYCTIFPCLECAKKTIQVKIKEIYYNVNYGDMTDVKKLFNVA
ncbi:6971_t:CDS:2, partial [Cetraspora pellucida]